MEISENISTTKHGKYEQTKEAIQFSEACSLRKHTVLVLIKIITDLF